MINQIKQAVRQVRFYLNASNSKGHGVHPPFVYSFITEVMNDKRHFYAYDYINYVLQQTLKDKREIIIEGRRYTIAQIASCLPKLKYHRLLFCLVEHYKPKTILEIANTAGTSLGITTAYLAAPSEQNQVMSVVANETLVHISKENMESAGLSNCSFITLDYFNDLMTSQRISDVDLIVIHLAYENVNLLFEKLLMQLNNSSIVILLNINSSLENKLEWDRIKAHTSVTCAIELWNMGLIFFRKEQLIKQQFAVRF